MFYRLRNGTARAIYNLATRRVLELPPLAIRDAPLRIVSMVSHRDLQMYLVAARSFYRRLGEGRFVVLNDGSLTADDKAILARQLGEPEIIPIASIDTGPCPRGGTWERLFKIAELSQANYVIQRDSDTLTRGEIAEVEVAYRGNRSFTLGTESGTRPVSAQDTAALVAGAPAHHVQIAFERAMPDIPEVRDMRYVRASSGFAGFAKSQAFRDRMCRASSLIEGKLGAKWHEWGSEQVMSNLIVANAPDGLILNAPKYINYYLQPDARAASFIHFIGTHRFDGGLYLRESRAIVRRQAS